MGLGALSNELPILGQLRYSVLHKEPGKSGQFIRPMSFSSQYAHTPSQRPTSSLPISRLRKVLLLKVQVSLSLSLTRGSLLAWPRDPDPLYGRGTAVSESI